MAQKLEQIQITVSYGHDGTHVIMETSRPVQAQRMTPDQCMAMIGELSKALAMLQEDQSKVKAH